VGVFRDRLAESGAAVRSVAQNPGLRRLELAWAMSILGQSAFVVAVSIYAFTAGGTEAVALIILLRFALAAVVAPFAGVLADRYRRESVLLGSVITRIVLVGAAAIGVFADVTPAIVYTLAVLAAIATTPFRSAQAALVPPLSRSPSELTAANVVASTIESIATFAGPALAGILVAIVSAGLVFLMTAGMLIVSAFFLMRIHAPKAAPKDEVQTSTILSEAFAGFRTIGRERPLRVLVGLLAAQTLLFGALQVFTVVLAVDVLDIGTPGVGYLTSALGVGAVIGAISAVGLTGARRLSPAFIGGIVLIGAPLVVLGLWAQTVEALILLGVVGFGSSVVDVAGLTLVQRAVPENVLARVFGVIQMAFYASIGIGAIVTPRLIDWLGTEHAILATGLFLVALTVVLAPRLMTIDAAAEPPEPDELRLLGRIPIFAPLPGQTLEHLATRLVPLRVEPGTVVVKQGDEGDRFYLIAEGELDVSADDQPLSKLEAGDYFGEIALLRDLPRTATVTAASTAVLYGLDRADFLAAVTGHSPSAQAAEEVVSARLATFSPTGVRATAS
jgi:MFS family permease